eukprot:SAG11_NODE_22597_length_403_cov_0.838816_1_plen_97_part_01
MELLRALLVSALLRSAGSTHAVCGAAQCSCRSLLNLEPAVAQARTCEFWRSGTFTGRSVATVSGIFGQRACGALPCLWISAILLLRHLPPGRSDTVW